MAKWGEIKCPKCSAPPISLWESMGRSLEEGDAREARLEARIAELEAQITAMEGGLTAVHMAGYMDGKKAAEAKLAKAMTGLNSIASNTCCDKCQEAALVARTTLAELKGQDDGQAPHAG